MSIEKFVVGHCTVEIDYEPDAPNPFKDYDCNGNIWSLSRRHNNHKTPTEIAAIMKGNPYCVPLSYYEHGQCLWDVQSGARIAVCPDKQWDQVEFAGIWEPDKDCLENIEVMASAILLPGVKVAYKSKPNPDGTIEAKNLNIITYTLPDLKEKGGYKTFLGAYRAAARVLGVVFDAAAYEKAKQQAARDMAKSICELYTDYCNGNCYCYAVSDTETEEVLDSCGGIYGFEYCKTEATETAQHHSEKIEALNKETALAATMP